MSAVILKRKREDLFMEIANTLHEWPDLERRIFSQAHYHGQSPESISRSFKLDVDKVIRILRQCDRKLQNSLRKFRMSCSCSPALIPPCAERPLPQAQAK